MLVVFGGLPGTGKTTLGKALAAQRAAVYVRVDEIETALALNTDFGPDIGPAGYIVAFAIARSNLALGNFVVADSVNPVLESRSGWRTVAEDCGARCLEIEVICSDAREHRRRVETRVADIAGHDVPTWDAIQAREYAPWTTPRLVIDTALLDPAEAIAMIKSRIDAASGTGLTDRSIPSAR